MNKRTCLEEEVEEEGEKKTVLPTGSLYSQKLQKLACLKSASPWFFWAFFRPGHTLLNRHVFAPKIWRVDSWKRIGNSAELWRRSVEHSYAAAKMQRRLRATTMKKGIQGTVASLKSISWKCWVFFFKKSSMMIFLSLLLIWRCCCTSVEENSIQNLAALSSHTSSCALLQRKSRKGINVFENVFWRDLRNLCFFLLFFFLEGDDSLSKENLIVFLIGSSSTDKMSVGGQTRDRTRSWCASCNYPTTNGGMHKVEAQSETSFFCTFGTDLYAQSVISNKIAASELGRKFNKGPLLVGQQQKLHTKPPPTKMVSKKTESLQHFKVWIFISPRHRAETISIPTWFA